jgi:hypothetical protein
MLRRKPWAVFVYMVADAPDPGNLDEVVGQDLNDILRAAAEHSDLMHLAVQADFSKLPGIVRMISGHSLNLLPETNAARGKTLRDFIHDARQQCPADRTLVLLWGHSEGATGLFTDPSPGGVPETMKLPELARSLQRGMGRSGIDIVMFKNCCMSALETAFELNGIARYMVASEARVPEGRAGLNGKPATLNWPYPQICGALTARKDTQTAAKDIVSALGRFSANSENRFGHPEVPYTLVDTRAATDVTGPLTELVKALRAARTAPGSLRVGEALFNASLAPAPVGDVALPDVITLCDELSALPMPDIASNAASLAHVVRQYVVLEHRPQKSAVHGIGICYPPAGVGRNSIFQVNPDEYASLKLCRATEWQTIALNWAFAVGPLLAEAAALRQRCLHEYAESLDRLAADTIWAGKKGQQGGVTVGMYHG